MTRGELGAERCAQAVADAPTPLCFPRPPAPLRVVPTVGARVMPDRVVGVPDMPSLSLRQLAEVRRRARSEREGRLGRGELRVDHSF